MTATRQADPDRAARRALVARALWPFIDGTAPGMASSLLTEARVRKRAQVAGDGIAGRRDHDRLDLESRRLELDGLLTFGGDGDLDDDRHPR